MNPADLLKSATNWPFLSEPLWRWGVFLLAMGAMTAAWSGVERHMRAKL